MATHKAWTAINGISSDRAAWCEHIYGKFIIGNEFESLFTDGKRTDLKPNARKLLKAILKKSRTKVKEDLTKVKEDLRKLKAGAKAMALKAKLVKTSKLVSLQAASKARA